MKDNDLDINELTEDQQLALQQFTSVTDQDLGTALSILRKTEWNVQVRTIFTSCVPVIAL